jgi:hypothetical protein
MAPSRLSVVVACVLVSCGLGGCMHITHPARVLPGYSADVAVGRAHLDYGESSRPARDPEAPADFTIAQLHLRQGWVLPNGKGVQIEVIGQKRWRQDEQRNQVTRSTLAAWVDLYGQVLAGPVDVGIGGVFSGDPEIYFMAGKHFTPGGLIVDAAVGLRFGYFPAFAFDSSRSADMRLQPFSNLALTLGRLRVGAFLDAYLIGGPLKLCDDACFRDSYVSGQLAAGAFTGWMW